MCCGEWGAFLGCVVINLMLVLEKRKMATISDGLYQAAGKLAQIRGDSSRACQVPAMTSANMQLRPQPEGMEATNVWSSWRTGGSDRAPANYPCALGNGGVCQNQGAGSTVPTASNHCGKSLVLRETSMWADVTGSADGTGYRTTNWLSVDQPRARIGECWASRAPVKGRVGVSRLYLDGKPAVHYFQGTPFLFRTGDTVFIYMVPNAIMARVNGLSFRVDSSSAAQQHDTCEPGCI